MDRTTTPTILIVDDDEEISHLVAEMFRQEGFAVTAIGNGSQLDGALECNTPNIVILDLMLPGEDGISICRRLRARHGALPILMLTAKSDPVDRVVGLEIGADDYVTKPFNPRELLARVRAILRRTNGSADCSASRRFTFEGMIIDLDGRVVTTQAGDPVVLTSSEFDLLACFVERPRRVLSRDQLLDLTRGSGSESFDRAIDMTISRLRKKLDQVCPGVVIISTVRNNGYLFTPKLKRLPP
jgi:two-component system, OmpR family, response regulator